MGSGKRAVVSLVVLGLVVVGVSAVIYTSGSTQHRCVSSSGLHHGLIGLVKSKLEYPDSLRVSRLRTSASRSVPGKTFVYLDITARHRPFPAILLEAAEGSASGVIDDATCEAQLLLIQFEPYDQPLYQR